MRNMLITCVHQGYELYGSDRCFAESVETLRKCFPDAEIEVILPRKGPIESLLVPFASRIVIEPIWVLRRQGLVRLATTGALALIPAALRAARRALRSDLLYINTCVILDYTLAARLVSKRTILHIHEIPQGAILQILRGLARFTRAELIFNSKATKRAFALGDNPRHHVVYNGISDPGEVAVSGYDGARRLKLLMLGRINRMKGQEVLLEALSLLSPDAREKVDVRIVGSAFESEARETALAQSIVEQGLSSVARLEPFLPDPTSLYEWADIVVVPSKLPEPLGRVAIEAMAFKRPPIISDIGGLAEVAEDGRSGWLVPPGNAKALASKIEAIVATPDTWRDFPQAARERYLSVFSAAVVVDAISQIAIKIVTVTRAAKAPQ